MTSSSFTYRSHPLVMCGFAYALDLESLSPIHSGADVSLFVTPSVSKLVQESLPAIHRLRFFSLTLGPDLPRADEPSPGNLGFSTDRILTCLFVTYTGILTSNRSTSPSDHASPLLERSPTTHEYSNEIRRFGMMLSPGTFSAQSHSTSELLRTL